MSKKECKHEEWNPCGNDFYSCRKCGILRTSQQVNLYEEKDKKIADLEAKLAESESELEKQKEKYDKLYGCYKNTSSEDLKDKYRLAEEVEKLKKELIKKDKIIKDKETIYKSLLKTCHNSIMENEQLKQQLAEKEHELEDWKDGTIVEKLWHLERQLAEKDKTIENLRIDLKDYQDLEEKISTKYDKVVEKLAQAKQDKISFCIERLEKVKELVNEYYGEYSAGVITNIIDNQIEELKKEMK